MKARDAVVAACAAGFAASAIAVDTGAMLWAEFRSPAVSHSGAPVKLIAVSEKPGDAVADPLALADDSVRVSGRVSRRHASAWSTLGMEVAANAGTVPVDLSAYRSLRMRLSSDAPRTLRIRLKGPDTGIQNEGCYPVVFQRVDGPALDLEIPLAAFEPEPYCGPRGVSVVQTLPAVVQVEVTANEASDEPVRFGVGRIEFVKPLAAAAVMSPPPSAAPPASVPSRNVAWKLAWSDEFGAAAGSGLDDKRWLNNKVRGASTPVHDGNGHLVVAAPCSVQVRDASALVYGRVEIRLKLPTASSLRISLRGAPLAALNWPEEGEIALLENEGADTRTALYAPGIDEDPAYQAALPTSRLQDGFHTVALEWEPLQWRWQVDGATVKTLAAEDLPAPAREVFEHWPFLLRIDAMSGSNSPLLLDHVRVYQSDDVSAATRPRLAAWLAARGGNDTVAATPSPRPAPRHAAARRSNPSEVSAAPAVARSVTCERNKLGLMMCY